MVALNERRLWYWNLFVGLFQIATGVVIAGITDKDTKTPWYTNFSPQTANGPRSFLPRPNLVAKVTIGYYSAVFLWLSGIDHLAVTTPFLYKWYNRQIANNQNIFRWIEYSVSASVMRVMIAQLSGITDIHLLFSIFGLTASTMFFGWLMESMNGTAIPTYAPAEMGVPKDTPVPRFNSASSPARKVNWAPFVMGFVPHAWAWSIICCYFFQAVSTGDAPGFVWAIIFVLFFVDLTFAVNQFLHFKQLRWYRGFAKFEFFYIILSITAKQLLAWLNFGGTFSLKN